jgi:hypothetical protein
VKPSNTVGIKAEWKGINKMDRAKGLFESLRVALALSIFVGAVVRVFMLGGISSSY